MWNALLRCAAFVGLYLLLVGGIIIGSLCWGAFHAAAGLTDPEQIRHAKMLATGKSMEAFLPYLRITYAGALLSPRSLLSGRSGGSS